jgi:hypothetical protein
MRQLEIEYFFPLTEQIPLDLDFTPSNKYDEQKFQERISGSVLIGGSNGTIWATVGSDLRSSFQIDIDQTSLTVISKTKPNFFRRYLYTIMGVKWKAA